MSNCRPGPGVRKCAGGLAVACLLSWGSVSSAREAPWVGTSFEGLPCEAHEGGSRGPFDYRTERGGTLGMVERHHFTTRVEQLIQGETTVSPMPDIKFVLVAYPNHHRALYSAVQFSLTSNDQKLKRKYPAECFLQRAINFSPRDAIPRMLFGLYLHRLGHIDEALEQYANAEALMPENANLLYNIGLAKIDQGDLEGAKTYADRAYALGMGLPGLREKLEALGVY